MQLRHISIERWKLSVEKIHSNCFVRFACTEGSLIANTFYQYDSLKQKKKSAYDHGNQMGSGICGIFGLYTHKLQAFSN